MLSRFIDVSFRYQYIKSYTISPLLDTLSVTTNFLFSGVDFISSNAGKEEFSLVMIWVNRLIDSEHITCMFTIVVQIKSNQIYLSVAEKNTQFKSIHIKI